MKSNKLFRVLFLFVIVFTIMVSIAYLYVLINGRKIILTELDKRLGVKAEISSLHIGFPISIVAEDFVVQDSLRVDRIVVVPSLFGFLKGDVILNSCVLDKPYFKITRQADGVLDFGGVFSKSVKKEEEPGLTQDVSLQEDSAVGFSGSSEQEQKKRARNFYLKRLKIRNAVVDFVDRTVGFGKDFCLRLDEFNVRVSQASFLNLSKMHLDASGQLKSKEGVVVGGVELSGWFDYPAQDMDMKLSLKDARLAYLEPYYTKFFKKELKSGNMLLMADIKSEHNDLKADCHVELDNIAFKSNGDLTDKTGKSGLGAGDFAVLAFDSILSTQGKMIFDFSVQTKMDQPKFENVRFKGTFLENGMKAVFSKGPQIAAQVATGGTPETVEDFKAIGKKFENFGKQFKGMFKKD
ncbi:MAG: DUF748 domain-containing protein [Candidatus Omnitrophota bacterium]